MVELAYSDERAEAFRAYMCLYGYKAAIDRCDWVAARRWFYEKEGKRSRATARRALFCVAFATAYMVLHISMPQLVEEVPRPLRNVMEAGALIAMIAEAMTLVQFKEDTFDELPPSIRDDILSHLGLRTFSCTSYTGRRRDARYSSGVIHPSPCEILPERNHRIQESRAPMNSPRAAPLQSRA